MAARFAFRHLLKAVTLHVRVCSYRPRNIPGSDPAAVPPPVVTVGRVLIPPIFPKIKTRDCRSEKIWRNHPASEVERIVAMDTAWWPMSSPANEQEAQTDENVYDLLIIGAGTTGAGIALDAATRGLKVAVVERDHFSSDTSSKSTKLVHGGVRYLEKAIWELDYNQYRLVKEALQKRKYFLDTAPHLSSWLPIMLPIQKWYQVAYFCAGTQFYDYLARSEGIESSYFLTESKALDAFPMLKKDDLFGALAYYDGAIMTRMNVALAMTAALYGSTVVNHLEVAELQKDASGKLCGARVKDLVQVETVRKQTDSSSGPRALSMQRVPSQIQSGRWMTRKSMRLSLQA